MTTHTAVKQGKAWAQSVAAQAQQWKWYSDEFEVGTTRPKGIAYKTDPLAIVLLKKLIDGKANYEIAQELRTASTLEISNNDILNAAADIRKYYRNKLVMLTLKGKKISKFRQDLYELVETDNILYLREDFIPMLVKLPDFYEEDKMFDRFAKEYDTSDKTYHRVSGVDKKISLVPVEKHRRKTTKGDATNYYFTDHKKRLYKLELNPNNPCMHLFDREFNRDKLDLKCNVGGMKIRGTEMNMFYISNWQVLFDE